MTVNVDLLRRTLAHIEAHPEEWNQKNWHCGSAACFAGTGALLAGAQWLYPEDPEGGNVIGPLGQEHCDDYLILALGLDPDVRDGSVVKVRSLFYANNTLDDLRRIVAELCDGAQ